MRDARHVLLLFATMCSPSAFAGLGGFGGWLEWAQDDNPGSSLRPAQARSSASQSVFVGKTSTWLPAPTLGGRLQFGLGGTRVAELPGLDHAEFRLSARLWWAASTAVRTHWLELQLDSVTQDFDSELRDGREWRVGLAVRRRFSHRHRAGFTLQRGGRVAASEVFSLRHTQLSLHGDWRATQRQTIYGSLSWQNGQRSASARPPDPEAVAQADAIVMDDALPGLNSYRLDARTWQALLGWSLALTDRWGLDLRARGVRSDSGRELRYERTRVAASLLFQF